MTTVWTGHLETCDICSQKLESVMYDANTKLGWANTCQECFDAYGRGLGTGLGQKYEEKNGRWLKVGG